MRSTLSRLERQQTADSTQALETLGRHFDDLTGALIEAGRKRGYLGGDPMGALAHLCAPATEDLLLAGLVADLWRTFFAGFRPDEANFEAARFATAAGQLNERLAGVPAGQGPDLRLAMDLLEALTGFWDERQAALSQRIDQLIAELTTHQQQLGSAQLDSAYRADELERATGLVRAAVADLGETIQAKTGLTELLATLVKRWRAELGARRAEADELRQQRTVASKQQGAFLNALAYAASGKMVEAGTLPESLHRVAREVADVVAGFREQEQSIRASQRELAKLRAELADKDGEIANRDQLIARYEFGETASHDADRRLELYRNAVLAWEAGKDPKPHLEAIRQLERVLGLSLAAKARAAELVDRHLDGLVKTLTGLRKILPLCEDPRRYRPRLFAGSPYDLKQLSGLMQAARDAGRDLLAYAQRARWAAGVQQLGTALPKLRRIFREMVRLVADCRQQAGGPPPAAATLSLDTIDGLASLPAVLAVDVQALAKSRSGKALAGTVVDVLDETVATFHGVLQAARGNAIARPPAAKRESPHQVLLRLAEELLALAGVMDGSFAEAKAHQWLPQPAEAELLTQLHLLHLGGRDLDAIGETLAACAGAPDVDYKNLPRKADDLDALLTALVPRVTWLEEIARYRIEVAG